jgi:hypothetical protein
MSFQRNELPLGFIQIEIETSIVNYLKTTAALETFTIGDYSAFLQLNVCNENDELVFSRNSEEVVISEGMSVSGKFDCKFVMGKWWFQVDMILSTPAGYLPYIGNRIEVFHNKPSLELETVLFNEEDFEENAIISYEFSRNNLCFSALIFDCSFNPSAIQIGLSSLLGLLNEETQIIDGEDAKISFTENLLLLHQFVETTTKSNNTGLVKLLNKYEEYEQSKNLKSLLKDNISCLSLIPVHKAVKIAMDILSPIVRGLGRAPELNYELVHRQFDSFCRFIFNNKPLNLMENEVITEDDQIVSLSLRILIIFVCITGLWFSHHAYVSYYQCHALNITVEEYSDIRDKFLLLDGELNGYISGHSLIVLFQDIGIDSYSKDDCDVIQSMIDRDDINCIDFIEFLRWWCSDSIIFE